jgi:hypothetical protein
MQCDEESCSGEGGACECGEGPAVEYAAREQAARCDWWRDVDGKGWAERVPVAVESGGVEGKGGFVFREGA